MTPRSTKKSLASTYHMNIPRSAPTHVSATGSQLTPIEQVYSSYTVDIPHCALPRLGKDLNLPKAHVAGR